MAAPILAWNDSLAFHIQEIDSQHRMLVTLINTLHSAFSMGKGPGILGRALRDLAGYTQAHFAAEERLMEAHGYPGLEDHRRIHRAMAARVQACHDEFAHGRGAVTAQLVRFLKDWLTEHIQGADRGYVAHLSARGVK